VAEATAAELWQRIRSGDKEAAAELVRRYEPAIRTEVRLRLRDRRLRRFFDSMDVCQAVLSSFFLRAAAGQCDLEQPEQLLHFLIAMTRNKVAYLVRRERAQQRDHRRLAEVGSGELKAVPVVQESPSDLAAGAELLREFRSRLTEEERILAESRAQGKAWHTIAAELGGTAEGRRKQLGRAVERVLQALGLEEHDAPPL
jgi:DNA-directed RNA polymerase specialized sigma24 family protein